MAQMARIFTFVAENLDKTAHVPGRSGMVKAVTEECENARTVLRHCSTRMYDLAASTPAQDPRRLAAATSAFRTGRARAATVHRHLAHALAILLDDGPPAQLDDAEAVERERRLGYQMLCAITEGRNAAVAAGDELVVLSKKLPSAAAPEVARTRRSRAVSATASVPAAGQPSAPSGRRR
ncbi:hypothetical protein ACIRRH_33525 [Kitasatospora sp. NPDC101235]|uniref:hypothetical protein n=1 Tax=Kitasatospora sp. NPDC101235 TaxID=3364101 RepID=UPI0037F8BAA7